MNTIRSDKLNPCVQASPKIVDKANESGLHLTMVQCCVSEDDSPATIFVVGKDFEYHTSDETFSAAQCDKCGLIHLNPSPAAFDFERIYPPTYHAYDFSANNFSLAYKVRSHFVRWKLFHHGGYLPDIARILGVGCSLGTLQHSFQMIIK